ncbi:LysR family transcriptional regulator [uncultured Roseobacter sp.]|uniref:LysR family transcriptional regulator n=1 Tax=uncultured Roseobacter sp. TaxID=114847 RepID=UPI002635E884|nr:LysR family transcriptional regulator [uncultured Roseobacter sp.]
MHRSKLSLKSLEIFREAARSGQVQTVAREAGLSISTVSHHLRQLEQALGVTLLDHSRRPMALTAEGTAFLDYVEEALALLRRAESAALTGRLSDVRNLRLALIEDFDSQIAPELAKQLARVMPDCRFAHLTRPSHDILSLLHSRAIDIGIATLPQALPDGLTDMPLLRDPYVLALPVGAAIDPQDCMKGACTLPFLRYSDDQIIGKQISTHLRRQRIELPHRFQFESNQSLMGMVADGTGWAITTPTNYLRARRFSERVTILPLPGKEFARSISLLAQADLAPATTRLVWQHMRRLISDYAIEPALQQLPWLRGRFILPDPPGITSEV